MSSSPSLVVRPCRACGTLWGDHAVIAEGRPWDDSYLGDDFVRALRGRRERQAATIADLLEREGAPEPILDYGCGQGVLVAHLLAAGVDAWGCDLDPGAPAVAVEASHLQQLDEPWGLPAGRYETVVMLDVLEHHPDPVAFLRALPGRHLLLKVPSAKGPAAVAARSMARVGRAGTMDKLFLVGEHAPHRWLATARGLATIGARAGWERRWGGSIVEVGRELPDRIRPRPASAAVRAVLAGAGAVAGTVGRLWSDALLAYFERVPSPST